MPDSVLPLSVMPKYVMPGSHPLKNCWFFFIYLDLNRLSDYAVISGLLLQRSPLLCANIVKKDLGKARQNSLATAEINFTKPGAHNKGDLCIYVYSACLSCFLKKIDVFFSK